MSQVLATKHQKLHEMAHISLRSGRCSLYAALQ